MKFIQPRPFTDPEAAARKLMEIANATEAVQDGRIHIERSTGRSYMGGRLAGRIRCGPEAGDRPRLALDARERDLCEIHSGRRRAVRLIAEPVRCLCDASKSI